MFLSYCMTCVPIFKHHVISLLYRYALAIVVEAIVGETTPTQRWRSRCRAGDDGDHDDAWRWRSKAQDDDGHIMSHILIACDVYLIMLLILLRTTVAL